MAIIYCGQLKFRISEGAPAAPTDEYELHSRVPRAMNISHGGKLKTAETLISSCSLQLAVSRNISIRAP